MSEGVSPDNEPYFRARQAQIGASNPSYFKLPKKVNDDPPKCFFCI